MLYFIVLVGLMHELFLMYSVENRQLLSVEVKLFAHKKKDPIGSLIAWQRPTLAERKSDYHRR